MCVALWRYHNGYLLFDDWDTSKTGLLHARWVDDAGHNPMTCVAIKNNIVYENYLHTIFYYHVNEAEQFVANAGMGVLRVVARPRVNALQL